jgi:hypothetical protein
MLDPVALSFVLLPVQKQHEQPMISVHLRMGSWSRWFASVVSGFLNTSRSIRWCT